MSQMIVNCRPPPLLPKADSEGPDACKLSLNREDPPTPNVEKHEASAAAVGVFAFSAIKFAYLRVIESFEDELAGLTFLEKSFEFASIFRVIGFIAKQDPSSDPSSTEEPPST